MHNGKAGRACHSLERWHHGRSDCGAGGCTLVFFMSQALKEWALTPEDMADYFDVYCDNRFNATRNAEIEAKRDKPPADYVRCKNTDELPF